RNRGTIGGSLAHADPAADWPLALAGLGAELVVQGSAGEYRRSAATLVTSAFTPDIGEDEIVTAVLVPKLSKGARFGYFKFCRKTGEFPDASAAVVIEPERDMTHVYLGALSGPPQPLTELARRIAEGDLTEPSRDAATEAVAAVHGLDPIERHMHVGTLLRALERAFAR
ncbi:MAG TPA: FAD binding domain-containing protein, partial [Stellaceae bacterium]|nr:FAD binding domain-containing protein [Stellaceae bacterium]